MIHLRHKWEPIAAEHFYRGSVFCPPAEGVNPLTLVFYHCATPRCPKVKAGRLDGHWTLEQVRGQS